MPKNVKFIQDFDTIRSKIQQAQQRSKSLGKSGRRHGQPSHRDGKLDSKRKDLPELKDTHSRPNGMPNLNTTSGQDQGRNPARSSSFYRTFGSEA